MIRQPAVAGFFYPAGPKPLHHLLDQLLQPAQSAAKVPKAIIAPHAGYQYSGQIAASAYARVQAARSQITRVVLIGPSHKVGFQGLAVSAASAFATPLGAIPVDSEAIQSLLQRPFVQILEQAHSSEHSLEVQLPFLQLTLDNFTLVPFVVGRSSPEQVAEVITRLWGGDETLIVISSDLSHYLDYGSAQIKDRQTSQFIEQLDYEKLDYDSACGRVPISGLLKTAKDKNLAIKTIDLRNSGDTAGNKARVVGYGAYVID